MTKKIIIAGGSGFLGKAIIKLFPDPHVQFIILGRGQNCTNRNVKHLQWDGKHVGDWLSEFEGADALINLTGRTVDCRYNEKNKKEILDSRINATECIGLAIRQCKTPPKLWINAASATIYRHAEDRDMDEDTGEIGKGFSVDVCKAWEKTFNEIETPATRKIILRIAIVLGKNAGVMVPMKNLVRLGLGGKMGNGKQYFSWIHEKDLVNLIHWLMTHEDLSGTFNCCAPHPLTNTELMKIFRKELKMPFGIPQPVWLLKFGAWLIRTETELILKSRRVVPKRLMEKGFRFEFTEAASALHDLIKK